MAEIIHRGVIHCASLFGDFVYIFALKVFPASFFSSLFCCLLSFVHIKLTFFFLSFSKIHIWQGCSFMVLTGFFCFALVIFYSWIYSFILKTCQKMSIFQYTGNNFTQPMSHWKFLHHLNFKYKLVSPCNHQHFFTSVFHEFSFLN